MFQVTVTPLAPVDAERLAVDLLRGEGLLSGSGPDAVSTLAEEVDYFPYYIHHVVAGLRIEQLAATENNIRDFVARQLVDASDPWQLGHYRTRLTAYYPDHGDAEKVSAILDVLSVATNPLSAEEILRRANAQEAGIADRSDALRLLRSMDADHYLSRDTAGCYRFRFPLIRRWWKLDRGL
jgi:hypothetical protein